MSDAGDAWRPDRRRVRAAVAVAVNRADPEGLLALGAPADEYDPEIEPLTDLVVTGGVTESAVVAIWTEWFGHVSRAVRSPAGLSGLVVALRSIDAGDP